MEGSIPQRTRLTVDNPRGDYDVLPSTLSRRTKTRNDSIQKKFLYTSFSLETQRRKYRSYYNVESAKHQNALLNFRRSLKQRPWRENDSLDDTSDAFSADVSNLSPVELSRFQLMRQIVAALPGEKVTIEDICSAMKNVGRTFTIDNDNKAVPVKRQPRRMSSFIQTAQDINIITTNTDEEKHSAVSSYDFKVGNNTNVKEANNLDETATKSSLLVPTEKMGIRINACTGTDASSVDSLPLSSGNDCFESNTGASEKSNPVFITEVNYKSLKSESKSTTKLPKVRRRHPVWQIRPKSPTGTRVGKERVSLKSTRSEKRTTPVVRHTDPYGLSYKGGEVEKDKKSSKDKSSRDSNVRNTKLVEYQNDRKLSKQSVDIWNDHCRMEQSESQMFHDGKVAENHSLSRSSELSACNKKNPPKSNSVRHKSLLTKTITWKEPLVTTSMIVDLDDTTIQQKRHTASIHKSNHTKSNHTMTIKDPKELVITTEYNNMTTPRAQLLKGCGSLQSKSVGSLPFLPKSESESRSLKRSKERSPLSFLIMHKEIESVCSRHRRWLVKTPDYMP